jgi:ATP-dependent Clp protease ATP-binding subunit ClpC
MDAKFSQRIKDVLSFSKEEAIRLGNSEIAPEHLLLGILREGEGVAIDILVSLGANLYQVKKDIEAIISSAGPIKVTDTDNIPLLKTSERILKLVYLEAKSMKKNTIDTGHLLLAIIKDENTPVSRVLFDHSIDYEKVRKELLNEHIS